MTPAAPPSLSPVHEHLAALAGTWAGDEALAPSPWTAGGPATGRHVFAVAAGGFAVSQDYVERRDGAVALRGHGVFCVDPATGEILWFWFDSIGFPPASPARGRADAAGAITLEKTTPRGTQRAAFARDGDVLHHRLEVRPPGAATFAPLLTATYQRTAPA